LTGRFVRLTVGQSSHFLGLNLFTAHRLESPSEHLLKWESVCRKLIRWEKKFNTLRKTSVEHGMV